MNFISLLQQSTGSWITLVTMAVIFVIFYFLLIRPQKKEQKKMEQMIASLKKGDKIVTIGGIHGIVKNVKEKTVIVKVDDSCSIEFNRNAIGNIVNPKTDVEPKKADE